MVSVLLAASLSLFTFEFNMNNSATTLCHTISQSGEGITGVGAIGVLGDYQRGVLCTCSAAHGAFSMCWWSGTESIISNNCSESCVCVILLTSEGVWEQGLLGVRFVFEDDLVIVLGLLDAMVD